MINIVSRLFAVIMVVVLAPLAIAGGVVSSIWTLYKGVFNIVRGK